jgi:hypothetical protein
MTLIDFISARIDDDEAAGKVSDEQAFNEAATDRPTATPFDPQRILREREASGPLSGSTGRRYGALRATPTHPREWWRR